MNGAEFYQFLRETFSSSGETIAEHYTFKGWVPTSDGSEALMFCAGNGNRKQILKEILIAAWEAGPIGNEFRALNRELSEDVRLNVLNYLVEMCAPLRACK